MSKFRLTKKAVQDLNEIWNYTFDNWSESKADKYYNSLISTCNKLANKPLKGKNYSDVFPELLGFRKSRHVIFYRIISNEQIEIIRFLHERMDLDNRLK